MVSEENPSLPGPKFAQDPFALCERADGDILYSSYGHNDSLEVFLTERVEEILTDRKVEAVRINDGYEFIRETPLEHYRAQGIVGERTGSFKAVAYGRPRYVTFREESVQEFSEIRDQNLPEVFQGGEETLI